MPKDIFKVNTELLFWVQRREFITREQLERYQGIYHTTAQQKLFRLYSAGYLDRVRTIDSPNFPYFYFITEMTAEKLSKQLELPLEGMLVRGGSKIRKLPYNLISHTKGVNDFFCNLLSQSRNSDHGILYKWLNSRECRFSIPQTGEILVPDGYGEFINGEKTNYFFFEYDRQTESMERLMAKMLKYMLLEDSREWERYGFESFPRLLFLTNREGWANKIKNALETFAWNEGMSHIVEHNSFMFSWECKEYMDNLLEPIWLKACDGNKLYSIVE
jgi:hypothetical protein